jgi:hypothetical protein
MLRGLNPEKINERNVRVRRRPAPPRTCCRTIGIRAAPNSRFGRGLPLKFNTWVRATRQSPAPSDYGQQYTACCDRRALRGKPLTLQISMNTAVSIALSAGDEPSRSNLPHGVMHIGEVVRYMLAARGLSLGNELKAKRPAGRDRGEGFL